MGINCSICKNICAAELLIHFEGVDVCGNCKTEFIQKLKEGCLDFSTSETKGSFFVRPCCPGCGNIVSRLEIMKPRKKFPCLNCPCILEHLSGSFLILYLFLIGGLLAIGILIKERGLENLGLENAGIILGLYFFTFLTAYDMATFGRVKKAEED
ncbi:MAG: hypothetical protein HRT89_07165 [Lentisphaeria bacterium]|nr:hypothetical protein [Lentisphaeria bacterium]NQZ67833.1 hypothetical protein [Lentisphaeria bacterium]